MVQRCSRFIVLCVVVLFTACGHQPWPVPVPEHADVTGQLKRYEMQLPVTEPACQVITLQEFLQQPERCRPFQELQAFLAHHAARVTSPTGTPLSLDLDLWALMQLLTSAEMLRTVPFPQAIQTLPEAIRRLRTWPVVDARDATPPQGRPPVAFVYRGFWWTFWQKTPPPPPAPGTGVDPRAHTPFDSCIVFPEFPGRLARGG
jgi:hypothetical protein